MRKLVSIFFTLACVCFRAVGADSLSVMFWNVENFFDYRQEGVMEGKSWNASRFYAKCNSVAKTIMMIADGYGGLPDVIGFAEIGDAFVMRQLLSSTILRKLDYRIVHFESPDHRGIDCALLYRYGRLSLKSSRPVHIHNRDGTVMPTRDILLAQFDSIAILVNHHPSKVGAGSDDRRAIAMETMEEACDSLEKAGCGRILSMGDFNDALWPPEPCGTLKYNGKWEKIDGCFTRGPIRVSETVCCDARLSVRDRKYGGMKPRRTYEGLKYQGGTSDHYPILLKVFF